MANPYYTQSGNPGTGAAGSSAPMRSEFAAVQAAFDKMPTLAGNANAFVVVNPGATGLTVVAGLTFNMNTFTVAATALASVAFNWPATNGTLALTTDVTTQAAATLLLAAPPGAIVMWGTAAAPSGWLFCGGQAVSRTGANAALFAAYGTTYGVGDGSTTFNLPDLRQRVPVGGTMGFTDPARLSTTTMSPNATAVGSVGGSQTTVANTTTNSSGTNTINYGGLTSFTGLAGQGGFSALANVAAGSDFQVPINGATAAAACTTSVSGNFGINVSGNANSSAFGIVQPSIMLNFIVKI